MRFDEAWETLDAEGTRGTDENDRPLVPDGRHVGTIKWVGEQKKSWAIGEGNAEGRVLTVKLDFGPKYRPVWDSVRVHWRHRIVELCQSARVAAPVVGRDWDERTLMHQSVIVETSIGVGKSGEYVKVGRYFAQADRPPEPSAPPERKPPAAAAGDDDGADDIPF